MDKELTEEEMRQALFGNAQIPVRVAAILERGRGENSCCAHLKGGKKEACQDLHPEAAGYTPGKQRV